MKTTLHFISSLLCCYLTGTANGQSMDGIWRGTLTQESGGCYPVYHIELQLHEGKEGLSYSYYDTTKFVKLACNSEFRVAEKKLLVRESRVLEFQIPPNCIPCIKSFELNLKTVNGEEILSGAWRGKQMGSLAECPAGEITLQRVQHSSFAKIAATKSVAKTAKEESREIYLVKAMQVDTMHLTIELYDSGQVDGDTVSVFFNHELLLSKQRLTDKALFLDVPLVLGSENELVMYAENLGAIPPNTAIMIVHDGLRKHEVYLSSNQQKSAAIRFICQKF